MGQRVKCKVEEVMVEGDNGRKVPGIQATCGDCGACREVFGRSDASKKAALAQLRENCEEAEGNFYVDEDE